MTNEDPRPDMPGASPLAGPTARPPRLGLGLVGCGGFGRFCLEAYRGLPGLDLVAACDTDPQRLAATAAEFALIPYADYAAMLADPRVQIVAINTPPAFHAAQAVAAARAGKHIFCEKPLATRLDDATQVLHVVREAGVQLSVDYVMRRNPLVWALHGLQRLRTPAGPLLGPLRRGAAGVRSTRKQRTTHEIHDGTTGAVAITDHGATRVFMRRLVRRQFMPLWTGQPVRMP